jgi:uncharacterized membrane protein YgcG
MDIFATTLGAIFSFIGIVLFQYWGWVLIAAYLGWKILKNKKIISVVEQTEHSILQIIVPKNNEKKELSAEQLFASLHGILRPSVETDSGEVIQEHISFEIASEENVINFYIWVPSHLKDYVESQVYAQYPTVQIQDITHDYAQKDLRGREVHTAEVVLDKSDVFPIKTFPSFEVDPLAGITTALTKLSQQEELWLQFLIRPVDDSWHKRSIQYIDEITKGKPSKLMDGWQQKIIMIPAQWIGAFFHAAFIGPHEPPKKEEKKDSKKELSTGQSTINAAVETKAQKLGYEVKIRIAYLGGNSTAAKQRVQALVGGFKQFNTVNLNGFSSAPIKTGPEAFAEYQSRYFHESGFILNIEELASLYHLPHISVETPNIAWTSTKVGEPPTNLPTLHNTPSNELSLIGTTTFRQGDIKFGIKRTDRKRHFYVIGKSGSGKSFLLELLVLSDIYQNQGFAIVDPHGDFAQDMLRHVPKQRMDQVVYFNPADLEHPIAFNPMENSDPNMRASIASEIVGVLKKMFADSWGPRLEHILRFTLLALLETPDATMLGITRMLTDKVYRKYVISNISDPVVKAFWVNEFASWNDKFASEAVAPVLNKVGAFTANPLIRNVLGQTRSSFDIRQMMDEGKILIVDLSRGRLGEDNASILGALLITKIQLAAMSRANIENIDDRRPFYLYVDEFQNFATESFAVILSEARKYGLYLTVANQYIAQMPDEVKDAVFGNVGSMVSFRVGSEDAGYLSKYFEPVFEPLDLVNLGLQQIYVTMSIDGETSLPFSAKTLMMPKPAHDHTKEIVARSHEHYSSPRAEVERIVAEWWGMGGGEEKPNESTDSKAEPHIPTFNQQKPNIEGVEPKSYSTQVRQGGGQQSRGKGSGNNHGGQRSSGGHGGGKSRSGGGRPRR